ncbi:alpha-L-fucosidase-like [Cylas formicarius]|uniref:alpha-L-fucosidase-like n=1 Tax=Cylas formicarius TaxID=197179 RepID=UPI00295842AC|nr:alpha-L-fucosidase-like [Cylas formicarius]
MARFRVLSIFLLISGAACYEIVDATLSKYSPNWDSLDSRPLPSWYDESKVGIFIHWGVFSVPSFGSEWFWIDWKSAGKNNRYAEYVEKNFPPGFSYQEFARDFTAEFFNATEWARLFAKSGAKYVVLTSKHHEGFTLWPSKYSFSWNAKDVGPHRDIVGELGDAVRAENLEFGLYHSLYEWYNPMYLSDKASEFAERTFVEYKMLPEMYELVNKYEPSVLWSDGDWEAPDLYWNSTGFLAWLYNDSPVKDRVVVNDRWGSGIPCKHGGFFTCSDRYDPGVLQDRKWENAMTLDKESWGFRRNARSADYMTTRELLATLASTISCGGNILINVGPAKDGTISPVFEERLLDLGRWLSVNGEAVYGSRPWTAQNDTVDSNVWYTCRDGAVYAVALYWPKDNVLTLGSVATLFRTSETLVSLLGRAGKLKWTVRDDRVSVLLPDKAQVETEHAWVYKITNFK